MAANGTVPDVPSGYRVAPQAAPPGRGPPGPELRSLAGKSPEKIPFFASKNVYGRLDFFSIRLVS